MPVANKKTTNEANKLLKTQEGFTNEAKRSQLCPAGNRPPPHPPSYVGHPLPSERAGGRTLTPAIRQRS